MMVVVNDDEDDGDGGGGVAFVDVFFFKHVCTEYGSRSLLRWKPITSFLPASRLEADSIYVGWKPSTEFAWKPVFTFWLEARIYVLAGSPFLLESDLEGPARGLGWKPARHN